MERGMDNREKETGEFESRESSNGTEWERRERRV